MHGHPVFHQDSQWLVKCFRGSRLIRSFPGAPSPEGEAYPRYQERMLDLEMRKPGRRAKDLHRRAALAIPQRSGVGGRSPASMDQRYESLALPDPPALLGQPCGGLDVLMSPKASRT